MARREEKKLSIVCCTKRKHQIRQVISATDTNCIITGDNRVFVQLRMPILNGSYPAGAMAVLIILTTKQREYIINM